MYEAARIGDDIGHSDALAGMLAGTLVGGLIATAGGIAAGALLVAGLGAACLGVGLLLVAASLAVGYLAGEAAESARSQMSENGRGRVRKRGTICSGSPDVFINGRPAAIAGGSEVHCDDDGHSMQMAEGSSSVFINGRPAVRTGDRTSCGARVISGSGNVLIGGDPLQTAEIIAEVPEWLYIASDLTLLFAGLLGGAGGVAAKAGALAKMLSRLPGINKLERLACRAGTLMAGTATAGIVARPVDIVSGQKFLSGDDELDFTLPSRLPVAWQRCWRSGNPGDSVLGRGWSLFWETRLEHWQDGLVWRAPSGDYISFPRVPQGRRSWCDEEKCWLEHHTDGSWSVYDISGVRHHYPPLADGPSLLSRLSDACGNDILLHWDDDNTLRELNDSAGQRVTCRYQNGRLTGAWLDDDVCLVSYAYDDSGQLITVTGRGGSVRRRFGWCDGLMSSHEDANGLLNEYLWRDLDGLPRVVAYRNSAGEELDFHYDFAGGHRSARRDDGARAEWLLDDDDNIAGFTDYDGRQTGMLYGNGELCGLVLPGGGIRRCHWDKYGRIVTEIDPLQRHTRWYWHRLSDRPAQVFYPDGSQQQWQYDAYLRPISETDALNNTTRWHYPDDEESLPCRITDALGGEASLHRNRQGLLTRYVDCSGGVNRYCYDRFGQLISTEDAQGNIILREWTLAGQLSAVIYPDGSRETLEWNARGQLCAWHDPLESTTRWQYDTFGLPTGVTDRIGRSLRWHRNSRGNLLRLENGNGGEYHMTYDAAGRLAAESGPDELQRFYDYDDNGHLSIIRETGQPAADGGMAQRFHYFRHDLAGQLKWRAHEHAEFHYHYDKRGRLIVLERRPTAEGITRGVEADRVSLHYDRAGRLLNERGVNGKVDCQWDKLSNLVSLTLMSGQQLCWLRYGAGHVSAIKFGEQIISEFTRDAFQRETQRTQGQGRQKREYDLHGRRTRLLNLIHAGPQQQIAERLFRYSLHGELTGITDSLRGEIAYGYDAEGRLKSHYEPLQGLAGRFAYDAADNLADDAHPTTADNRLRRWNSLLMSYDSWGRLISRRNGLQQQHYCYDADNRLTEARGSGPQGEFTARYYYDALGRRTRKEVTTIDGTTTRRFLWQGFRLLHEQCGELCNTYLYDPNEFWSPLARVDHLADEAQGETFWFSTDLNGAPLEARAEDGTVRWSGHYTSWGEVIRQSDGFLYSPGKPQTLYQPLRYAGQYADDETGLHYNLFRYYDPMVGRFTTQDPEGIAGGLNLYAYGPNPLGWIDPLGLSCFAARRTQKGVQKGHNISKREAIRRVRNGEDVLVSIKQEARAIARAVEHGKPMMHAPHVNPLTGSTAGRLPHVHPNQHLSNHGHIFYGQD